MKKLISILLFLIPALSFAQLELPFPIKMVNPTPVDYFYYEADGTPWDNTGEVTAGIPSAVRYRGMTVNVAGVEYWFRNGITNGDLVVKGEVAWGNIEGDIENQTDLLYTFIKRNDSTNLSLGRITRINIADGDDTEFTIGGYVGQPTRTGLKIKSSSDFFGNTTAELIAGDSSFIQASSSGGVVINAEGGINPDVQLSFGISGIVVTDGRSTKHGIQTAGSGYVNSARDYTDQEYVLSAKTFLGKQIFFTSTTGSAALNIPSGLTPSSPINGDVWQQGNHLWMRLNGVTYQIDQQGGGTVTSITLTQPAAGLTITGTGTPITTTGTPTFALANDLAALENISTTGLMARTGSETYALRTITGTTNVIDVTNGDGVSGNPTLNISSSFLTNAITGGASTIITSNLTANSALISNGSGKVAVSATVSDTELGYLDGVTSAIQTQFSNKQPLDTELSQIAALSPATNQGLMYNGTAWALVNFAIDPTTSTGDILYRNSSGNIDRLGAGSNGQVLTLAAGIPSWAAGGASGSAGGDLTGTYPNPTLAIDRAKLIGSSTYTGAMTWTGTLTAAATNEAVWLATGTYTGPSGSGSNFRFVNWTPTLVSGNTNQNGSVFRIAPTFTPTGGAFSNANIVEFVGAIGTLMFDSNGSLRLGSRGLSFDIANGNAANGINYATGVSTHGYTTNGRHNISFGTITTQQVIGQQMSATFGPTTGAGGYDLNVQLLTVNQTGSANGVWSINRTSLVPTAIVGTGIMQDYTSTAAVNSSNPLYVVRIRPTIGTAVQYGLVIDETTSRNGIGTTTPTAKFHISAGSTAASTAPLKLTSGSLMTTAEAGAIEFLTDKFYATITTGTARREISLSLDGSATLDFASTNAQESSTLTITVTGAADGDPVSVGPPNGSTNANSTFSAYVSSANTVTVKFNNYSAAAIDPASGTFKVRVHK